jgi:toxin ParE1/3/4
MKPVAQRELAQYDISNALDYYLHTASALVASDFLHALDQAMCNIADYPEIGSPRYGELLEIDGLRFSITERFPYVVFYFVQADYIDVIRVLH